MKLLFIDDDESIVQLINRAIIYNSYGHDIKVIQSASEAKKVVGKEKFDVIISDMRMNGISGIDIAKEVKSKYPDTVFVLLTGYYKQDVSDNIEDILPIVDLVIEKPVIIHEFIKNAANLKKIPNIQEKFNIRNYLWSHNDEIEEK